MRILAMITLLLASALMGEVVNQPASMKLIEQNIPVVDIRTPSEWKETGLFKGSIPIMFFNERGSYDVDAFMKRLKASVDTSKPFALICRTGSRTSMVANFLSKEFGYNVINVQGGILYALRLNLPIEPYKVK